jgi:hypothetical protein
VQSLGEEMTLVVFRLKGRDYGLSLCDVLKQGDAFTIRRDPGIGLTFSKYHDSWDRQRALDKFNKSREDHFAREHKRNPLKAFFDFMFTEGNIR